MRKLSFTLLLNGAILLILAACTSKREGQESQQTPGGDPERGRQALVNYGCINCHAIPGIPGDRAYVGPPLADWAERQYIAGLVPNETEYLVAWIMDPQALEPNTAMPDLGVSEQNALDISAYLYTLRRRGLLAGAWWWIRTKLLGDLAPPDYPETQTGGIIDGVQGLSEEAQQARLTSEAYARYCASCHRWDGKGLQGSVPSLRSHPLVISEEPEAYIQAVLQVHANLPGFRSPVDNSDLAGALTYARTAWTNHASIITEEMVQEAR